MALIGPRGCWAAAALVVAVLGACASEKRRDPAPVVVRFETASSDRSGSGDRVTVSGLTSEVLRGIAAAEMTRIEWEAIFPIHVGDPATADGGERPAVLGDYSVDGDVVRFEPRFPFVRGQSYHARWLEPGSRREVARASVQFDLLAGGTPTRVTAIYPSASSLPENLLRFYVHFSAPMSREQAIDSVRLIGPEGPVELPFVAPEHELWNGARDRLTLILDPGRIKRGVGPNIERGPVLTRFAEYRLEIDAGWRDGAGHALAESFSKSFEVVEADRSAPRAESWQLIPPRSPRDVVRLYFQDPLDHAMMLRAIRVESRPGREVAGRVSIGSEERSWSFAPDGEWPAAECRLVVDPALEDPSGNRIGRPFDAEIQSQVGGEKIEPVELAFVVEHSLRG